MGFEFSALMLIPLMMALFAGFILLNHEKVHEWNKRTDKKMGLPKIFQATHHDPDGKKNAFGAAGVLLIAVFMILGMGFGLINT